MQFTYETPRLNLAILKADHKNADRVLNFYLKDAALFERFEPDRVPNYYTTAFQRDVLKCEYDMAMSGTHMRYYITLKEDPYTIIGTVCFHNIKRNYYSSTEIGYKLSSEYHHQGYAKEAINYLLAALFEETKLHRVNAWIDVENEPSRRLLEKLGFEKEGLCKDYLYSHGKYHDHLMYCMTNPFQC